MKLERELSTSERDALQASISEKLAEILGVACDPVLAEYTIVLVSNGKTMEELREAMNEMIGPDMSASLAAWLGEELKPLADAPAAPADGSAAPEGGGDVTMQFDLPPGAYATMALREVMRMTPAPSLGHIRFTDEE